MSYLGIGSPIPDISSLPGQTGGEVEVTLDYPSSSACTSASPFSPSEATPVGGVFAATPSGLNINSSTGEVTPVGSTPQAYTISYTVSGVISQFALTINIVQQSTFSYSSSSFQQIGTATPTLAAGTTLGGTFTASTGVSINSSTGVIDLAASTIGGPYTITYTTPGPCASASTFTLSITAVSVELIPNNFAMEFNGTDEYVNSGSLSYITSNVFTISGWVKTTTSLPTYMPLFNFQNGSGAGAKFNWNHGGAPILWYSGSTYKYFSSGTWRTDGLWHNVVLIIDKTTIGNSKMFIDGVEISGGTTAGSDSGILTNFYLGYNPPYSQYYDGEMDEVAIWNKALQLEDVQRIYNATNNNPGKCANLFTAGLGTDLVFWNRMGD